MRVGLLSSGGVFWILLSMVIMFLVCVLLMIWLSSGCRMFCLILRMVFLLFVLLLIRMLGCLSLFGFVWRVSSILLRILVVSVVGEVLSGIECVVSLVDVVGVFLCGWMMMMGV